LRHQYYKTQFPNNSAGQKYFIPCAASGCALQGGGGRIRTVLMAFSLVCSTSSM
jgi:hypothetical protein